MCAPWALGRCPANTSALLHTTVVPPLEYEVLAAKHAAEALGMSCSTDGDACESHTCGPYLTVLRVLAGPTRAPTAEWRQTTPPQSDQPRAQLKTTAATHNRHCQCCPTGYSTRYNHTA